MNQSHGVLALVGSGEYLPVMQEFETGLLHSAVSRGKQNSFVQIPTGSSEEGEDRREFWRRRGLEQSDRIGSECIYLPIHEREDAFNPEFVAAVKDAGLIYFSGGNPHHIADVFKATPLWDAVVQEWESGSSLAGCSAGAMAFGGTIMGIRKSSHSEGLSLLPDIEVIPHYDKMLGWLPDRVASFIARGGADTTLLGIDENTALIYENGWKVAGLGKVHVLRGVLEIR
ncbi:CphB Cyanophycinase and related exopeptidases [Candidatus Nanopelagicaceae bacterium]